MIKPRHIKNMFKPGGLFSLRAAGAAPGEEISVRRRTEVTERRLSEEMTLVDEVARIVTSTPEIEQIYRQFFLALRKLVPYDLGGITILDPGGETYSVRHVVLNAPSQRRVGDQFPLDGSYSGEVLSSGRSMLRESILTDSSFLSDRASIRVGIRSILVVPLVSEGLTFGTIVLASRREGTFGYWEQALLERLATQIAPAMENARLNQQIVNTQQALSEIEERFRTFVEQAADPIFVIDRNGRFVDVNDMACSTLGYSRQELLTMAVSDVSVAVSPQRQKQTWECLDQGKSVTVELEHRRKDGSTFPVEVRTSLIELGAQRYQLALARDLTERQRGEEIQRRLTEENSVMAEIGRIISSSLDIDQVYERFAAEVRKLIPFDRMNLCKIDMEEGTSTSMWVTGLDVPEGGVGIQLPITGHFAEEALRLKGPVVMESENEADMFNRYPSLVPHSRSGLRSFLAVRLYYHDAAIGLLHLQSKQPRIYGQHHLDLAERIGNQIAGAFANAQLFAERKQLAEENSVLAEIGRVISSSLDISELYEKLGEKIRKLIPFDQLAMSLVVDTSGTTSPAWTLGTYVPGRQAGDRVQSEGALAGEVVRTRRPIMLEAETEADIESRFPMLMPAYNAGLRSFLTVPLIDRDAAIGVLQIRSKARGVYTHRSLHLLESIGDQIAGAVASSQLYAERTRLADENQVMAEIGRIIGSSLDVSEVYEGVYQEMRKLVHFDRISVNLADLDQGTFTCAYILGTDVAGKEAGHVFPIVTSTSGASIIEEAIQVYHPSSEADLTGYLEDLRPYFRAGLRSFLAVPLLSSGATVGVMRLSSATPNAYTDEVVGIVERIAAHITPALENARLYSERKKAEEQVRESLREKEVLLQEINHRVKNNLQIVSSLLSLQARSFPDDSVRDILQESQDRIRAMALIHDKLYLSEDLSRIDFGDYLWTLTGHLQRSHGLELRGIEMKIDSGPAYLGLDTAIPCGLIVNELVSNSMKHAFKADDGGEIRVSLREQSEEYTLVVTDNGVGFPEGFDLLKSETLGLKLVNALVGQLGGDIELHRNGGSEIRIRFPLGQGG